MKIIKPTVITDAMLVSSSVPEPDAGEEVWVASKAYAAGNVVIRTTTHRKYERKVAGTSSTAPESDPTNWFDIGPTNRWAMFDRKVGTTTTAATSVVVALRVGGVSGIGALELTGRELKATLRDAPGGAIVYTKTIVLDGTIIESVYEWFFADFEQQTDAVMIDLPQHFTNGELTIELTGTSGVEIGVLQAGQVIEVGMTKKGASVGITDFSKKERDVFGNFDILERTWSKNSSMQVLTDARDFNKIYRRLASIRAVPCIYIGTDRVGFEPMITYGFYKDFGITVDYEHSHLLNIEIEGL
ncbi:hypothetical protein [Massilia sp. HP4]|uniref:hypothetical protein n=1 Tax=Massilia sp. HP4 TaxID=2562316 RepID=UPI0010C0270B|nr:hypothetical protein [Massilia sp. HP4]